MVSRQLCIWWRLVAALTLHTIINLFVITSNSLFEGFYSVHLDSKYIPLDGKMQKSLAFWGWPEWFHHFWSLWQGELHLLNGIFSAGHTSCRMCSVRGVVYIGLWLMHHYWKNKIKSTHLESLLNYKQSTAEDEDRLWFAMVFYNLPWTWSVQFLQCKLHLFDGHSSWWVWNFWHRSGWWSCVAGKCQQNNEAKHNMSCYAMLFENENQLDTSLVFCRCEPNWTDFSWTNGSMPCCIHTCQSASLGILFEAFEGFKQSLRPTMFGMVRTGNGTCLEACEDWPLRAQWMIGK